MFCSNDYLGLSHDKRVIEAAVAAAERYGCGTGGAPGTSGTTQLHQELAAAIAAFKKRRHAVLFPSGYAANVAAHASLASVDTSFLYEERHHPSAIEGIILSGCARHRFNHLDFNHLEELLKKIKSTRKIVTVPSVFTVDGAIIPLDALVRLKEKYGIILILDEAHSTGALGVCGRGIEEHYKLEGVADIIMGTFSKALGAQGGFLAFDEPMEKLFEKPLRQHIYSTSLSAMAAGAALKSLQIICAEPELVAKMKKNIQSVYDHLAIGGLKLNQPGRHIVNVYFDNPAKATAAAARLCDFGYLTVVITVAGVHGLRITAMSTHSETEINGFCRALVSIINEL